MRLYILLLLAVFGMPALAQRRGEAAPATPTPAPVQPAAAAHQSHDAKAVYTLALKYRDVNAAIYAVYEQLAANPNDAALKDSLASLYFIGRSYVQALAVARDILAADANNAKMLEVVGISEQALGRNKEALEAYEKLFPISKNAQHLYQVAVLQFSLQRVGECMSSLAQIIQGPDQPDQKVVVALNQQQAQEVPLKAAAWNVRGVALRQQKDDANAKVCFQEALKLFPDFILAKNNLAEVEKPAAPAAPANRPAQRPGTARPSGR